MLTRLFPKSHRRYSQSPVGDWLQGFAEWLTSQGYACAPARGHVRRLKQVLQRVGTVTSESSFTSNGLASLFLSPARQQARFGATQRAFERFLRTGNRLITEPDSERFAPLLAGYRTYLLEIRGLTVATVAQHVATASTFLAEALPPDAPLAAVSAQVVEAFVTSLGQRLTRPSLRHSVARLRAFLRFCHTRGTVRERLDSIDTPRTYRDELPPRALAWNLGQGLLRSIDRSDPLGCRDHAILYLMAHYGLRPSEVVSLTLESIDWANKPLRVEPCKTRSALILPLADSARRVLKRYLRCGRPGSRHPHLFLRARTPRRAAQTHRRL